MIFHKFLLPLLVSVAMTVPVNPEEPSTEHSTIPDVNVSNPTTSSDPSAPASVKVASPSESDPVQILESKESDESDESDETKESNEAPESQNSKEADLPSHQANVTKTVDASKDSIDVSAPVQIIQPDPPSSTSVKTTAPVPMSELDATTISGIKIRDVTFLPSNLEPNTSLEVPLYLKTN